ncbi:MAG: cytochrome c [Xanthomonadales bacterium]|nr:cytochrome c [Xanthomonadales bacterium]
MKIVLLIGLSVVCCWTQTVAAETMVERGRYIVEVIGACGNCHTPQGPGGPDESRHLAGGNPIEEPGMVAIPRNITPDMETGIGAWTDAQIITAIREGVRPDGRVLGPPMPFGMYRQISDRDVAAIVAYLRMVKPVNNQPEPSSYDFPLPESWGPPVDQVPEPDRTDEVAYGAYLAGPLGHCIECHSTPDAHGFPDLENALGAGGMLFHGPWGVSAATNLTPTGLSGKSDAEIKQIITTGMRADGSRLRPPMGFSYYAHLTDGDLDAIVAYLRSLPPR